jgi:hypothetical protein
MAMGEKICRECGKPFLPTSYSYDYCPVCRSLFGIERRSADDSPFPPKGRDLVAERLRDGFAMLNDDDAGGK